VKLRLRNTCTFGNKFVKTQVNKASATRISQIRMRKGNVVKRNLLTTEKNTTAH